MFTLNNITKNEELNYLVTSLPCPACKDMETIEITPDKLYAYNQGAMAQDVLSGYDAGTRERFISGMCNDCFCTMNNYAMFDGDEEGHCVDCDDYHAIDMPCEDE